MPVSDEPKSTAPTKTEKDQGGTPIDPATTPGFHVVAKDGTHLGTYETEEDAQAFIDGHVNDAKIVEGAGE